MAIQLVTLAPITIAITDTATPVSSDSIPVTSLSIQAEDTNVGNIYFGDSTITAANGFILVPGATGEITADMIGKGSEEFILSEINVLSSTGGNKVRLAAFRRKNLAN